MGKVNTAFVDRREAQMALAYARQHYWGLDARLTKDVHGDYWIVGLVEGEHDDPTCCPANLHDIHEFGG